MHLWIILADTSVGVSVPCGFFLASRRTAEVYETILNCLRDEFGVGPPKMVLIDFEEVKILHIL